VSAGAEAAAPTYGPEPTLSLHGMLDSADTDDTALLRPRLTAAGPGADVVLTTGEEAAYQRSVDRFNHMWASGSGVAGEHRSGPGAFDLSSGPCTCRCGQSVDLDGIGGGEGRTRNRQ
jgi:hypothetical protein